MKDKYYVLYNPLTFDLMDKLGAPDFTPLDILSYLNNLDASDLDKNNYLDFLRFDLEKERKGLAEYLCMDNYVSYYIANQISRAAPDSYVLVADEKRRTFEEIIKSRDRKPEAVFATSMSSNFPAVVAAAIALNHAEIPVIVGGIHVSTSPGDVDLFIRNYSPHPRLISLVKGAGDSKTMRNIMSDLKQGALKPEYTGYNSIEDGMWGSGKVITPPVMKPRFPNKLPFIGDFLTERINLKAVTPYIGCPYSCNFCSVSSLPIEQRRFISRSPEDFVNELKDYQKEGAELKNRFFFFLPDNFMLGGKALEEILDRIIDSGLKLNHIAMVSIEIAEQDDLLDRLRRSGASHFFIGLESLDIRNLEYIGKNVVKYIDNQSVKKYYSKQIRKIQDHGISVLGAFMFGLPYDYFNSLEDHSGREVADFCQENKIGLQPTCFTDLPGSQNFKTSQENGTYRYGRQGSMDYLLALSASDFVESNRTLPDSLKNSPLIASYMTYYAAREARIDFKAAFYMAGKAWRYPTANGRLSLKERFLDSLAALIFQLAFGGYADMFEPVARSRKGVRGFFERLFDLEKDPEVKSLFENYIRQFINTTDG